MFIAIGFLTPLSNLIYFCLFTYMYTQDMSLYLNHFYLLLILQFLLTLVPCNNTYALDNVIWPKTRTSRVPRWSVLIFQYTMAVVYTWASVAKVYTTHTHTSHTHHTHITLSHTYIHTVES